MVLLQSIDIYARKSNTQGGFKNFAWLRNNSKK